MLPLPQLIMDSGRNDVVSSAEESVITLYTDPGSKGAETARFSRAAMSPGLGGSLGSKVGKLAIARISPLRGSIATRLPDLAWCCATILASSCSATD